MVGYGEDQGIIPKACEEIFRRIDSSEVKNVRYEVTLSMMEIYNEKVRDLLNPKNNPKAGLPVREHPKTGPFVVGLKKVLVKSYAEISRLMGEGEKARTVGATKMNATSSRAHTLVQIIFSQVTQINNKESRKVSKINLVDLAGSEKLKHTGASGKRKAEGIAINQSLTSLGNCISALADKASGKKGAFVPYRNSKLTFIMKESLGGNSKTAMIAAVSPASVNFEESLSTLRYANRAKKIQNKAKVNEDPTAKLIKDLKKEIERLKEELLGARESGKDIPKEEGAAQLDRINELAEVMEDLTTTEEEKINKAEILAQQRQEYLSELGVGEFNQNDVHLLNLNEDPSLSEKLLYGLRPGQNIIGKDDEETEERPDIILSGDLLERHASIDVITKEGEPQEAWLIPFEGADTYYNGQLISDRVRLNHKDRIVFNTTQFFCFIHPEQAKNYKGKVVDFEQAMMEMAKSMAEQQASAIIEEKKRQFKVENDALQRQIDELEESQKDSEGLVEGLKKDQEEKEKKLKDHLQKSKVLFQMKMLAREKNVEKQYMNEYSKDMYQKISGQTEFTNLIMITIAEGKDLIAADYFTKSSDPYVVVDIIDKFGKKKVSQRTKTIKKNLNPYWNETHCFRVKNTDKILVTCWDWDLLTKDDFLGNFTLTLADIPKKKHEQWYDLKGVAKGKLRLKLWNGDCLFVPSTGPAKK